LKFNNLRVYAVQKTSTIHTVRIVGDYSLKNTINKSITVIDTGKGSTFDTNTFLLIGGEELIVGTISTKDNVLFAGNIEVKRPPINIETFTDNYSISMERLNFKLQDRDTNNVYIYSPHTLNKEGIRCFRHKEVYRFGIQFQYKNGLWSDVLYLKDEEIFNPLHNSHTGSADSDARTFYDLPKVTFSTFVLLNKLHTDGYKRFRFVYVPPDYTDKSVICQGFITNTIGRLDSRGDNNPFSFVDYYARPF